MKFVKRFEILRDIDGRDAGNGGSDLMDIFSMDFGDGAEEGTGGAEPSVEASKPEEKPQQETGTEGTQEGKTEDVSGSDVLGGSGEGSTGESDEKDGSKENEVPAAPAPAKKVPSSEELLAQALQALSAVSSQKGEKKMEEKAKKEEDEDEKVFRKKEFSDYSFNISPKLYNALFNPEVADEERVTALQGFASGIATTVHNNIMESLGKWTRSNFNAIPRVVDYLVSQREASVSSAKNLREDFYSSFPELNKPEFAPIIRATIQSVQRETGAKTWTTQIRNEVGNRVKSVLAAYAQGISPKPSVAPKTIKPTVTPPAVKPQNTDPNSTDAILDVLYNEF